MAETGEPQTTSTGSIFSGKALFAVVAWGASFSATRIALSCFLPTGLVAARLTLGAAVLVLLCVWRQTSILPQPGDRAKTVFLGAVLGVHLYIQAFALQHTSAINAAWILAFIPVTIALGAQFFLKQRLRRIGWLGVTMATSGVALVAWTGQEGFVTGRFGDLIQLSSCLTWTVYTLVAAGPLARNGALRMTTTALLVAMVCLWVPTLGTGVLRAAVSLDAVVAILFLGVVCNGIAYYLWLRAVDEHGPIRSGSYIYLEPFVSIVVASITLGESITGVAFAGGVAVLFGVHFVAKGSRKSPPADRADSSRAITASEAITTPED